MRNEMQLKALVRNISKEKNISAQFVLQNYMLERILERIYESKYKCNFILKGGFLIGVMIGLDTRTTMDMDVTIKNILVDEDSIKEMISEIISIKLYDDINFEFNSIKEIRLDDEYSWYRVALRANLNKMSIPLKIDITTGDKITPREINYEYKLLLEDKSIGILAYNLETILSEKLEAIISRGDKTTRTRDYYDVYILSKLQYKNININNLNEALIATSNKRGTLDVMRSYKDIIEVCYKSDFMKSQWLKYQSNFSYAENINFEDTCDSIIEIMDKLEL